MQNKVIIFGCGGHARSVLDVLFTSFPKMSAVLVDPEAKPGEVVMGCPVLKEIEDLDAPLFYALGSYGARYALYQKYEAAFLLSIVSTKAHIGYGSHISPGVFVGHGAHIGPEGVIGLCSIINTGAIVEHEGIIGDFSHIAPKATIAGRCKIGHRTMIGCGAIVRDKVEIGSDILIGAGAVVVSNILEPGIYVGCPAKKLKL